MGEIGTRTSVRINEPGLLSVAIILAGYQSPCKTFRSCIFCSATAKSVGRGNALA